MNNFEKIYFEMILEDSNVISEGKFLNNLMAGVGGLAITGGSVLGLNELSKVENSKNYEAPQQIVQSVDTKTKTNSDESDIKSKKIAPEKINLSDEEYFLARVIYSETSTKATIEEIKMLCQVIVNRIGLKDFGNGITTENAFEVVNVKNAFSCINDPANLNWEEFKPDLNERTKLCCKFAKILMRNDVKQISFYPDKSIVYYHDKSISQPKKWTNRYWRPVLKYSTKNFKFYSVTSNAKRK